MPRGQPSKTNTKYRRQGDGQESMSPAAKQTRAAMAPRPRGAPLPAIEADTKPRVEIMPVTPEMAVEWLDRNYTNRAVREGQVEKYARDMASGHWAMNTETIKFDVNGVLLDGQHRLWAIVESGATVRMAVAFNLPSDVLPTIDTGKSRTYANVLQMRGGKHANVLAAVTRLRLWYDAGAVPGLFARAVSNSEMDEVLEKYPSIIDCVSEAGNTSGIGRMAAVTPAAFTYHGASLVDEAMAKAWLHSYATGVNLTERNPVYRLRERLLSNKMSSAKLPAIDVLALCVKSWAYFRDGREVQVLGWKQSEPFPRFEKPEGR